MGKETKNHRSEVDHCSGHRPYQRARGVRATQSSLPGSALYPVKLRVEELRMARTQTTEEQIARTLESVKRRLDEAKLLVEHGDTVPGNLVERYNKRLSTASGATRGLTGAARSRVQAEGAGIGQPSGGCSRPPGELGRRVRWPGGYDGGDRQRGVSMGRRYRRPR